MNNNTLGTYIWLGIMAILVFILRMGDGGMDGIIGQIDGWFLAATSLSEGSVNSVSSVSTVVALWPFIVVGGLLVAAVAVFRSGAGDDDKLAARKHLVLQYKLQAKDLDA